MTTPKKQDTEAQDECAPCFNGGRATCACSREQVLCFDLSPSPLPTLRNGLWGTKRLLEATQLPARFLEQHAKLLPWLLAIFTVAALAGLLALAELDLTRGSDTEGALRVGCPAYYWRNESLVDNSCGTLAQSCRPFETGWFALRCPTNCLRDWAQPVIGSEAYTATSRICASAIHAGVISNEEGGCFEVRFAGERAQFAGVDRNGVDSEPYGWFPRAMEFREISDGAQCNGVRPWIDAYVFCVVALLYVFIRPSAWYLYIVIVVTGTLYLVTDRNSNLDLWQQLNQQSPKLLVNLLFAAFLWPAAVKRTMPKPQNFPLDGLIIFFLPFWLGIHLDALQNIGLSASFTAGAAATPELVAGLVLFIVIGVPLVSVQFVLLYKAGKLGKTLLYAAVTAISVGVAVGVAGDSLSLHVHHYMIGGFGVLIFQGQPRLRYSIIAQGVLLGVLINGVSVWDIAPLFDEVPQSGGGGGGSPSALFYTAANLNGTTLGVSWATTATVFSTWNCSQAGFEDFVNGLDQGGGDATRRQLGADVPSLQRRSLQQESGAVALPGDDQPFYRLSVNTVIFVSDFFPVNQTEYSAEIVLPAAGSTYWLAVAGTGGGTTYLTIDVADNATSSEPEIPGAGFYDGNNATFVAEPCNRVYAIAYAQLTT